MVNVPGIGGNNSEGNPNGPVIEVAQPTTELPVDQTRITEPVSPVIERDLKRIPYQNNVQPPQGEKLVVDELGRAKAKDASGLVDMGNVSSSLNTTEEINKLQEGMGNLFRNNNESTNV